MIGNDIVDLNVAFVNSRWKEQRFLDKLFTQEEQKFILNGNSRYQNIWHLWSMKESAYKIYARNLNRSIFNPHFFSCKITSKSTGTVTFDECTVNTTTECNSNIIYTTACLQNTLPITEYVDLTGISQAQKSQQLSQKSIQSFAQLKQVSEKDISIIKNDFGVPQFYIKQKIQDNFLSLTHHGKYGGFAISI